MTNKTTMPEPVAWLHEEGDHIITAAEKRAANATFTRYGQGLITTWQAEAYANAMVRKALEEAAQACEARIGTGDAGVDTIDCDVEAQECAAAIRALIPKEPPCET